MLDFETLVKRSLDRVKYPEDYSTQKVKNIEELYAQLLARKIKGDSLNEDDYGLLILKENNKAHLNQFFNLLERVNVDTQLQHITSAEIKTNASPPVVADTEEENTEMNADLEISHVADVSNISEQQSDVLDQATTASRAEVIMSEQNTIDPDHFDFVNWIKQLSNSSSTFEEVSYPMDAITPSSDEHYLASQSVQKDDEIISETLANIHAQQGDIYTAIRMYEQLSLKKPEKKLFFAEKIEELKNK